MNTSKYRKNTENSQGMPPVSKRPLRRRKTSLQESGATLLNDIERVIRRFIWLTHERDYAVVALWALYTHAHGAFDHAPRLALRSDLPGSGKSELLRVLSHLVQNGRHQLSVTPATLFRQTQQAPGTLLIDEFDKSIGTYGLGDIHAILNAGHTRGMRVPRTNKDAGYEVEEFEPFGPVAFGILKKSLPGDLADRSIPIHMERGSGSYEKFKEVKHKPSLDRLRARAIGWAKQHSESLGEAAPNMHGISNRAADNWAPLFAVADAVGGDWPNRIRDAALHYEQTKAPTDPSLMLLANIRDIYDEIEPKEGVISTEELLNTLNDNPEWPWSEWRHGEPLKAKGLAKLLKAVGPKPYQPERGAQRGYAWADIAAAWKKHGVRPIASLTSHASLIKAA